MATEKWIAGSGVGFTWTDCFAGADINSIANGSAVLSNQGDITNQAALDIFADLSTLVVGLAFAYHVWAITLDSVPFHLTLTTKLYLVPWLEWAPHQVGSWGVAALPGKFQDVELAVLQALFYVAPPAAAAVVVAKAFRR